MTDPLVTDARAFFAALAQNNSRDWFVANKSTYEARLKAPAMALLDRLSAPLATLAEAPVTTKLFRPNRDVRFSRDKSPYHLHLHLMWTAEPAGAVLKPSWFFGISPDYVTAGAGVFEFGKAALTGFRASVDADPSGWLAETGALEADGYDLREPELKRVPAPYDSDHPGGALLRRKGLAAWADVPGTNLEAELMAHFERLAPLLRRLATL